MTCIIGIAKDGEVVMGGDSAGVAGLSLELRADPKVFRVGDFLIGFTSSFRMGQLLMFGFIPPKQKVNQGTFEYMCTDFVEAVRIRLKEGGFAQVKDNKEDFGTFLVGYKGQIYKIMDNLQVGQPQAIFTACGCGEEIAMGAVAVLLQYEKDLEKVIQRALVIAEQNSAGVRSPFVILRMHDASKAD